VPERLGVFGGTFNPIHVCHLQIGDRVRDLIQLDRVIFVPASEPPHKRGSALAPANHRLEMTRLAVSGWPGFEVDDLELRRPGPSYSVDTIEALHQRHPAADLFFMIGFDMFAAFSTWREPERILATSRAVVIAREGRPFASLAGLPWVEGTPLEILAGFDAVPAEAALDLGPRARVILVKPHPCEISSTVIRRDLAAGCVPRKVLPAAVHSYILKHDLYGAHRAYE